MDPSSWYGRVMHAEEGDKVQQAQRLLRGLSPEDASTLLQRLISHQNTGHEMADLIAKFERADVDDVTEALDSFPSILPNPWVELAITDPDPEGRPIFQSTNPLFKDRLDVQAFPNEMILEIARWLPRESAISLALTNHFLLALLGPWYITPRDITNAQIFSLLRLLERDCQYKVACPSCLVLHLPYPTDNRGRNCEIREMHDGVKYVPNFGNRLPTTINYNIVRAIAKQRANGIGGSEPSFELLNPIGQTISVCLPTVKAIRSTAARFVAGDLVVRTQICVAATNDGKISGKGMAFIKECLTNDGFQICDHYTWERFMSSQSVLPDWRGATWIQGSAFQWWLKSDSPTEAWERFDQAATESSPIPTLENDMHPTLSRLLHWKHRSGHLRTCEKCLTDYSIGVEDMPDEGPVLVLTTWKNLGGPSDDDPYSKESARQFKWDTHRNQVDHHFSDGSLQILTGWSPACEGHIAVGFDATISKRDRWTPRLDAFTPYLEPHVVRRFGELEYYPPIPLNADRESFRDFFQV